MRILIFGSRSTAYPPVGVRLAFDHIRRVVGTAPVVIVHGDNASGVDDAAETLAGAYGWTTERHPADWVRCSPLCELLPPGKKRNHRKLNRRRSEYCPLAGPWRYQKVVDLHKNPSVGPYRLAVALPYPTWNTSRGTYDCYKRARAAGIETIALDCTGDFFVNVTQQKSRG